MPFLLLYPALQAQPLVATVCLRSTEAGTVYICVKLEHSIASTPDTAMGRHAVSQHAMAAKVMLGLSVLLISSAAAAGRPVEGTRLPSSSDGVASMQAACGERTCC